MKIPKSYHKGYEQTDNRMYSIIEYYDPDESMYIFKLKNKVEATETVFGPVPSEALKVVCQLITDIAWNKRLF